MKPAELETELSKALTAALARDLVRNFVNLSLEVRASALERVSAGKFVETVVQCLQHLATGSYDAQPSVDAYLRGLDSNGSPIPDDLRLTAQRIARAAYTIRNKRNVAHKGEVDPNIYDLRFCFSAAQWILSELVRHASKIDVQTAGRMIEFIQIPASTVVETIDGTRIVHGVKDIEEEILLLMNSVYPDALTWAVFRESLSRRSTSTTASALKRMHEQKLIQKSEKDKTYRLTSAGYAKANSILRTLNTVA